MQIDGKKYITEKEIAWYFNKSMQWIQNMRYGNKDFPHYKLNNRVYFIQDEVETWIKKRLRALGKIR